MAVRFSIYFVYHPLLIPRYTSNTGIPHISTMDWLLVGFSFLVVTNTWMDHIS